MNLILASQSPRRRELLGLTGLDFTVRVADIDETMDAGKAPFDEVARVSRLKALAVDRAPGDVVIAADTIVVCEGKVLGKPRDEEDAFRMLSLLSGRHHEVMTGMTLLQDEEIVTHTEVTKIHFRKQTTMVSAAMTTSPGALSTASAFRRLTRATSSKGAFPASIVSSISATRTIKSRPVNPRSSRRRGDWDAKIRFI